MPGSIFRAGLLEHFVHSIFVLIPFVAVTPVFVRDLPLLLRGILPLCEAFQLGILVDLYPELDDHRAPLGQFLLELVDLVISPLPVVGTTEAFQPFYHDATVPGTVKNAIRGYKEINLKAMKLLPRGGYLATCSCSHFMKEELFVQMLHDAAADANVQLRQIEARQQSPDHPILWNVPETYYLKFYIFQVV